LPSWSRVVQLPGQPSRSIEEPVVSGRAASVKTCPLCGCLHRRYVYCSRACMKRARKRAGFALLRPIADTSASCRSSVSKHPLCWRPHRDTRRVGVLRPFRMRRISVDQPNQGSPSSREPFRCTSTARAIPGNGEKSRGEKSSASLESKSVALDLWWIVRHSAASADVRRSAIVTRTRAGGCRMSVKTARRSAIRTRLI
jgi:hypothetical protein